MRFAEYTREDLLKIAIVLAIAAIDATWIGRASFHFDVLSTARVLVVVSALLAAAEVYRRWRRNADFVAMVRETAWFLGFSVAAAILSDLVVTLNLPLVDHRLVALDDALHLDWQAYYTTVVSHPVLGMACSLLYVAALPFIAFAIIALPMIGRAERAREMVLAAMIGALIAIVVSGLWPSSGALAYFRPDESLALHHTIVDLDYKQAFFDLRSGALTSLSLDDVRGLIAFPSYHATLNVVIVLAFRGIWKFFWPVLVLNAGMLATAPVEGGHHFVDVMAGAIVAIVAVFLAGRIRRWLGLADGTLRPTGIAGDAVAAPLV